MIAAARAWKERYGDDEVEVVACPVCGGADASPLAEEWTLEIARCGSCGVAYVRRRTLHFASNYNPDREFLLRKYGAVVRGERPHTREPNYEHVLDRLERFRTPGARLLDVGPHIGFFMRAAARRGWDVVGAEPSPVLGELAREQMGLDVRSGYLHEHGFAEEFDAVTFLDVLEHVPDPVETLAHARRALRPGGVALVKVPNLRWNLLKHRTLKRVLGNRIDAFDAREHLLQFSDGTLKDVFRRAGLEPIELFVPLPVQTGGPARRALRAAARTLGTAALRVTDSAGPLAPDLCLIGRRSRG